MRIGSGGLDAGAAEHSNAFYDARQVVFDQGDVEFRHVGVRGNEVDGEAFTKHALSYHESDGGH